jgi:2-succinyl-6-hydroxy-2,4-cyclohexadiene-1-carboxylate synthase
MSLILESASPGLATEAERDERQVRDNDLADRIERDGIAAFVDYWEALPLFASQQRLPDDVRARLRSQRLNNRPAGLANSLRGMGTGVQPSMCDRLPGLAMTTLLLAGEFDSKFVGLAQQMYDLIPEARLQIVPNTGHTIHLEAPVKVQNLVTSFLSKSRRP